MKVYPPKQVIQQQIRKGLFHKVKTGVLTFDVHVSIQQHYIMQLVMAVYMEQLQHKIPTVTGIGSAYKFNSN